MKIPRKKLSRIMAAFSMGLQVPSFPFLYLLQLEISDDTFP